VAGFEGVRRLVLVNALIFAVLAAAVTLAYYSYTSGQEARDREKQAMRELAQEKVANIEALIVGEDKGVFDASFDTLVTNTRDVLAPVHAKSVFVLDDKLAVMAGASRRSDEKEGIAFRDWFAAEIAPRLDLKDLALNVRGHAHLISDKDYLFSFMKKRSGDRIYYVVLEEDTTYILKDLFTQYFPQVTPDSRSRYVFQVIDSKGLNVCCSPFIVPAQALYVIEQFQDTADQWFVRVAERDTTYMHELERKRIYDSLLIGGAVAVIIAGLLFLGFAIGRERKANELKSDFISNVSHELKTPLSIISMFGEMLANGRTKGPEQSTEYAQVIWRESVRLGRLIDNVLDFAKMERGKEVYEFSEADVGEVVERAVDLVGRRAANAEMTIDVEIEPELPPVKLDANAFTLAVMNLIDNAIKYAADGKKVEVKLTKEGERLVLTVRDFGPGISAEEQEQIFERFYRARAVRLKPIRGSGIGLALVRQIARAHRGDVSVTSVPGKGATFQLWLPI
jgi:two-component system phosphate regulon sensor histidine kinase PhoR